LRKEEMYITMDPHLDTGPDQKYSSEIGIEFATQINSRSFSHLCLRISKAKHALSKLFGLLADIRFKTIVEEIDMVLQFAVLVNKI
jgi:hypothetical protein